jgi:hypothetical protein
VRSPNRLFDHPFFYALFRQRVSSKEPVSIAEQVVIVGEGFPSFRDVYKGVNHGNYVRNSLSRLIGLVFGTVLNPTRLRKMSDEKLREFGEAAR